MADKPKIDVDERINIKPAGGRSGPVDASLPPRDHAGDHVKRSGDAPLSAADRAVLEREREKILADNLRSTGADPDQRIINRAGSSGSAELPKRDAPVSPHDAAANGVKKPSADIADERIHTKPSGGLLGKLKSLFSVAAVGVGVAAAATHSNDAAAATLDTAKLRDTAVSMIPGKDVVDSLRAGKTGEAVANAAAYSPLAMTGALFDGAKNAYYDRLRDTLPEIIDHSGLKNVQLPDGKKIEDVLNDPAQRTAFIDGLKKAASNTADDDQRDAIKKMVRGAEDYGKAADKLAQHERETTTAPENLQKVILRPPEIPGA